MHEFSHIPLAAIHNNMSFVQLQVISA